MIPVRLELLQEIERLKRMLFEAWISTFDLTTHYADTLCQEHIYNEINNARKHISKAEHNLLTIQTQIMEEVT